MNRILYSLLFVLLGITAGAQTLTVTTEANDACINQSIWLKASGHNLYIWSDTVRLDTFVGDSVNFTATTAGNYAITVLGYTFFPADTDTVSINITVHANPTITVTSSTFNSNGFICLGDSATLTVPQAGISSYAWSPTASVLDSTSGSTKVFPTATTTYTVQVTDTNGCNAQASSQVKVNSTYPIVIMVVDNEVICPGQTTSIEAQGNGSSFIWTPAGSLNSSTTKTVIASPLVTTTYFVTATFNACKTESSTTIEVLDAPEMTLSESTNGAAICLDSTATITATCALCDYYIYNFPNSTLQTTNSTQVVSPNIAGAIDITVTGFADNGCSASEIVTINVDSCFNGTPFSIAELTSADVQVIRKGSRLTVSAPVEINSVEVYNLLGEKVVNAQSINKASATLEASTLNAGIYIVMVKSDSGDVTKKVYLN